MISTERTATVYRNTILQQLPEESVARLHLRRVSLPVGKPLDQVESGIRHILFIEAGSGSMTSTFRDGSQVEVGLFGNESAIGISAFMGERRNLHRIYMQIEGAGYASPIADAKAEFRLGGAFHDLALRYVQMQLTQTTQIAACNATHELQQRVARWLLLCADRSGRTELPLSQDFIAVMLGVRRASVNAAMNLLRHKTLVDYARGHIYLTDVQALEAEACECYQVLKGHLKNYLKSDSGFVI